MSRWWRILPRHVEAAERYAAAVRARRGSPNAHPWTGDGREDVYGKLGELVYGAAVGRAPRWIVDPAGDGGDDFPGVQVKATRQARGGVFVNCRQYDAYPETRVYTFVLLDIAGGRGMVLGWAGRDYVAKCPRCNPLGRPDTECYRVPLAALRELREMAAEALP